MADADLAAQTDAEPGSTPDLQHPGRRTAGPRTDVAQRRPYPTASTTTRLSPARAGASAGAAGSDRGEKSPVPATVWTFDALIPTASRWPVPVVERVLASFAPAAGTVVFIHWPDPDPTSDPTTEPDVESGGGGVESGGARSSIETETGPHAGTGVGPGGESSTESGIRPGPEPGTIDAAVASARALGYRARVVTASVLSTPAGGDSVTVMSEYVSAGSADLVITATVPQAVDDRRADAVTLLAARVLRAGGILAVLTHSDWAGGVLQDPTGTVVTAGQSADLLYLQHLVAVHQPLVHSNEPTAAQQPDPGTGRHGPLRHGSLRHGSVRHSTGRHRRVHSDVLVLVQPRDHALDLPNAAAA